MSILHLIEKDLAIIKWIDKIVMKETCRKCKKVIHNEIEQSKYFCSEKCYNDYGI